MTIHSGAAQTIGVISLVWMLSACAVCTLGPAPIPAPQYPVSDTNPVSGTFRTWGAPRLLTTNVTGYKSPRLAGNQHGEAIVIWSQKREAFGENIYASAYHPDSYPNEGVWTSPQSLTEFAAGSTSNADVAMDEQGNGLVIWWNNGLWARRYSGGTWPPAHLVAAELGLEATEVRLAMLPNGDALAVWGSSSDGTLIYSLRYSLARDQWDPSPTRLNSKIYGGISHLALAMDANGNAMVQWVQRNDNGIRVVYNACLDVKNQNSDELISMPNYGDADYPASVMDDSGNALILFSQTVATSGTPSAPGKEGPMMAMMAKRYDRVHNHWENAQRIDWHQQDGGFSLMPSIALLPVADPKWARRGLTIGNAVAVWAYAIEEDYSSYLSTAVEGELYYADYYDGWDYPFRLDHTPDPTIPGYGVLTPPRLAGRSTANPVVVWQQFAVALNPWAQIYATSGRYNGSWPTPERISVFTSKVERLGEYIHTIEWVPQVSVDGSGNAIAIWLELHEGYDSSSVYVSHFQ